MALYGVSLSNATTNGPGTAIMFDTPKKYVSMTATSATGNIGSIQVSLEVTIDGVNWDVVTSCSPAQSTVMATNQTPSGNSVILVGPVMGARANLTQGGEFGVSAAICGAD